MSNAIILNEKIKEGNSLKLVREKKIREAKLISHIAENKVSQTGHQERETISFHIDAPDLNGSPLMEYLRSANLKLVFTIEEEGSAIRILKERPVAKKTTGIIELSVKNNVMFIKPQDIIRMEASGSYTIFHFANSVKEVVSKNLKICETLLKPSYFYRCHSSHIINLHKVVRLDTKNGLFIHMSDGSVVELSRKRKDLFLDRIKGI